MNFLCHSKNPSTVNQLLSHIQELQDKVKSLKDADSERNGQPRFLFAAQYAEINGYLRKRSEDLPAQEGPSASFENLRNLASSSCGLRSGNTGNTLKHGEGVSETRAAEFSITNSSMFQEL